MTNLKVLPIAALYFLLLFNLSAIAVEKSKLNPSCGGFFDLCGYIDAKSNELMIRRKFERAFAFSEGIAGVKIKGKFGFIDSSGEVIIAPKFDLVGPFNQGLAEVLVGDVTGVIDLTGQYIVKPQFARAIPFTSDTLLVIEGKWKSSYFAGREKLTSISNSFLPGFHNKAMGLYHISSGWISKPIFRVSAFGNPSSDLIWASTARRNKGLFGLLRSDGSWHVEPRYTHVQKLNEGLAVVRGKSSGATYIHRGRKIDPSGAVDSNGNLVIPLKFNYLSYWEEGYGLAQKDGLHGLVTLEGTLLGGRYFSEVERPKDELFARVRDNDKWYSIEPSGKLVKNQNEGMITMKCPSGLTIREVQGREQFSHPKLKNPLHLLFDRRSKNINIDCEKPIHVTIDGKRAFVSQDGQLITDPPAFTDVHQFRNDLAAVSIKGKWGLIDVSGEFVINPSYDRLQQISGNTFKVKKNDREFWIDAKETKIPKPKPTKEDRDQHLDCRNGTKIFMHKNLFGIISSGGNVLLQPKYRAINCFRRGVAWAAIEERKQWCPLDANGKNIEYIECVDARQTVFPSHGGQKQLHKDPYESSVSWNRWYRYFGLGTVDTKPEMVRANQF